MQADAQQLIDTPELIPFIQGLKDGAPVAASFLVSFSAVGAIAFSSVLTIWQAVTMSGVVFAGPAQYAILTLFMAGKPIMEILVAVLIINFRFFLMSLSLVSSFRAIPLRKVLLAIPMLSASTFAVTQMGSANHKSSEDSFQYYLGVCAASFPVAIAGTALGFAAAGFMPPSVLVTAPMILAVYFAMMLAKDWGSRCNLAVASLAFGSSPLLHLWNPRWASILATGLSTSLVFWIADGKRESHVR